MKINYKSFALPGGGTLRINADRIIATVSGTSNQEIDIYCADRPIPFHIRATKHTPQEIIDYVWDNHDMEGGF